ncbi:Protein of unknown function DUF359 [Ferroglobus placidus DSM 10642]|uniref:GTP-dependent dephospho-CoA kinase n=1 Tax=Ferroglobus placidus (strain DSM 10642 / AEDII12DO) TaxID=589924 RepID=D3S0W2_FERPA|nr:GTP-dependent dephospho-CoA kinase family protein [Ferroglobus placidus]ADC66353.1 Protein of unknown function DUF359 [Ferroglobus placidus DSM 10642]
MLRMPESLRKDLQKPYGRVYRGRGVELVKRIEELRKAKYVACIGDLVSLYSLQAGYKPDIVVLDYKTEREKLDDDFSSKISKLLEGYEKVEAENPQSCISEDLVEKLVEAVRNLGRRRTAVIVKGEEDLATLVLAALMPSGSIILYGIPSVGIAAYEVGEKVLILNLLQKFEAEENDRVMKMIEEVLEWN